MTGNEIQKKVSELNHSIQEVFNNDFFTLNKQILKYQEEIDNLQKVCDHNFEEGYCVYCNKKERE